MAVLQPVAAGASQHWHCCCSAAAAVAAASAASLLPHMLWQLIQLLSLPLLPLESLPLPSREMRASNRLRLSSVLDSMNSLKSCMRAEQEVTGQAAAELLLYQLGSGGSWTR